VSVAIFTDMLVYGMVVPIFVPEILNVTTVEARTPHCLPRQVMSPYASNNVGGGATTSRWECCSPCTRRAC
jgi:hypothetical protein